MFSIIASSRLLPPVLLLATVTALRPLESGLVSLTTVPSAELAGSGGTLAMLGGMRTVLAGGFWLRANLAWEQCDAAATITLLHLTVAADERPLTFWLNGARMIAYDLPEWRSVGVPAAVRQRNKAEQAQSALEFLQRGQDRR